MALARNSWRIWASSPARRFASSRSSTTNPSAPGRVSGSAFGSDAGWVLAAEVGGADAGPDCAGPFLHPPMIEVAIHRPAETRKIRAMTSPYAEVLKGERPACAGRPIAALAFARRPGVYRAVNLNAS